MHLKAIKLAGFKSFVDPTTIALPGRRCAVVGPNGCGKSNVVDAVRWVLGESSVRQLRGEASTDVIFNGSSARRPTAMASVELRFDNADGRIGGEYAGFGEIAARREVTRTGQSNYYLNGSKCRRRDVVDAFLGTGFGSRSYSIIEQGMIGELVEARPEELRVYLEEAAGISRYKERRRETESRMQRAAENLERVRDIRDELAGQLARLQRQAQAARRYRELKAEQRRLSAQLLGLRVRAADRDLAERDGELRRLEAASDAALSEVRRLEADVEQGRAERQNRADDINGLQGHAYRLDAQIGRAQEEEKSHRARLAELAANLEDMERRSAEAASQLGTDERDIKALQTALAKQSTQDAQTQDAAAAQALASAEAAFAAGEAAWNACQQRASSNERDLQVERNSERHLQQLFDELARQLEELAERAASLPAAMQDSAGQTLEAAVRDDAAALADADAALAANASDLAAARADAKALAAAIETARADAQGQREQLGALEALQQAALGRGESDAAEWVTEQGLADAPRLGEGLVAVRGWERAVETVLARNLQAIKVEDIEAFADVLPGLPRGRVVLFEGRESRSAAGDLPALETLVRTDEGPIGALLAGVFAADSLAVALAHRASLRFNESIITREGVWLGPDWIGLDRAEDPLAGVIERGEQIEHSREAAAAAQERLAAMLDSATQQQQRIAALEAAASDRQRERQALADQVAALRAKQEVERVRAQEASARRQQAAQELAATKARRRQTGEDLDGARRRIAQLSAQQRALGQEERAAHKEREAVAKQVAQARQAAQQARERRHALELERERKTSALRARQSARQRLLAQQDDLARQTGAVREAKAATEAALREAAERLQPGLEERRQLDERQRDARAALEAADAELQALAAKLRDAELAATQAQEAVADGRVQRESVAARRSGLIEQIAEAGATVADTLAALPEDADEATWAASREAAQRRIARLGAINLAAIEECDAVAERKGYLDAQNDDLEAALDKLTAAMKKIDKETRERFKATFNEVNAHLRTLFPKVFGGGTAYLELTGEDFLDTGVSLMARPPGKRNSNVHMLSGGEKALTAVALIFAIFQLNPSPVCLLDEVDAPLDDTNVGRFAGLLKEMSQEVQFVVITHNKLTMDMADHLLGVTMNEPGVSRMVSVDVEEAAALAAV